AVHRDAHQLGLGVADVGAGQLTRAVALQQLPAGEAVVDAARGPAGATGGLRLEARHGQRRYLPGVPAGPQRGPRPRRSLPPDSATMSDTIPQLSAPRRHPSAGNLDARPTLVRSGEAPAPLPPASFPHGADLP